MYLRLTLNSYEKGKVEGGETGREREEEDLNGDPHFIEEKYFQLKRKIQKNYKLEYHIITTTTIAWCFQMMWEGRCAKGHTPIDRDGRSMMMIHPRFDGVLSSGLVAGWVRWGWCGGVLAAGACQNMLKRDLIRP